MSDDNIQKAQDKVNDYLMFTGDDEEINFIEKLCWFLRNEKAYHSEEAFLFDYQQFLDREKITFKRFLVTTQLLGFISRKRLENDENLYAKMLNLMLQKCID